MNTPVYNLAATLDSIALEGKYHRLSDKEVNQLREVALFLREAANLTAEIHRVRISKES
jgi:hypothetical protein